MTEQDQILNDIRVIMREDQEYKLTMATHTRSIEKHLRSIAWSIGVSSLALIGIVICLANQ